VLVPAPTLTFDRSHVGIAPALRQLDRSRDLTGTNLTGATAVNGLGTGVTVNTIVVVSSTQITANFVIANTATLGARNVSVTTPGGTSNTVTFTVR